MKAEMRTICIKNSTCRGSISCLLAALLTLWEGNVGQTQAALEGRAENELHNEFLSAEGYVPCFVAGFLSKFSS